MKPFVISDLHFDHKNIMSFTVGYRPQVSLDEHNDWIVDQWNSVVPKSGLTLVLGDVSFSKEGLAHVARLNGTKHLLKGNHDQFKDKDYAQYFHKILRFRKKYGFWYSHAPIHPCSLRGLKNIHGHVHQHSLDDDRYINVSVEALDGKPVNIDELIEQHSSTETGEG